MALADDFQAVLDTLPPDWTQLELDLRIWDEDRYVDVAPLIAQINASSVTPPPRRQCAARWR
jgi:hypothetical protein